MSVNKVLDSASFFIEVQNGTDSTGAATYKKKTFSGLRKDADAEKVFNVAEAIKAVLRDSVRDSFLSETSKLINS